jgi:IK cytokine
MKTASSSTTASSATPSSSGKKVPPEKLEARKKKKNFYAQLKRSDETSTKLVELSEKYRDRAKERREGVNTEESFDPRTSTSGYRAVAPDMGLNAAERRRKMIQESKYLGGDLRHTHLVKGLDYALLQKVRSEIT